MLTFKFLSTPSTRRATASSFIMSQRLQISIHALHEEGDLLQVVGRVFGQISIHALHEEGDPEHFRIRAAQLHFYPRPPRGGRPSASSCNTGIRGYFYPRPPRGGRPGHPVDDLEAYGISIHALHEEGDVTDDGMVTIDAYFYPRPPRGGRLATEGGGIYVAVFLSTPSTRRATSSAHRKYLLKAISIHALHEEGDSFISSHVPAQLISIHALHEEGDLRPAPCRGLR